MRRKPDGFRCGSPSRARAGLSFFNMIALGFNASASAAIDFVGGAIGAGGIELDDQRIAHPVDHNSGKSIGLRVDQPVTGIGIKPRPQPGGSRDARRKKRLGRSPCPRRSSAIWAAISVWGLKNAAPSRSPPAVVSVTGVPGGMAFASASIMISLE